MRALLQVPCIAYILRSFVPFPATLMLIILYLPFLYCALIDHSLRFLPRGCLVGRYAPCPHIESWRSRISLVIGLPQFVGIVEKHVMLGWLDFIAVGVL